MENVAGFAHKMDDVQYLPAISQLEGYVYTVGPEIDT